ncbi:MAG: type I-C CRISPR-associated protein Cas8c/Csd1 [Fuerstiella sp.]
MLHALKQYAEAIELESEPGFRPKEIKWLIVFDQRGNYISTQRLGDGKVGQLFAKCPDLSQPELKGGGPGCRHFLVDGLDVVTLLVSKGEPDTKLLQKHQFFLNLLQQASGVERFLECVWRGLAKSEQLAAIREDLSGRSPKAKPSDLVSFAILDGTGGQDVLVDLKSWHDWWRLFRKNMAGKKKTKKGTPDKLLCFLTGQTVQPVSTHPKITGLASVGGMAAGDVYASFKQESFQSYGLTQSANAAMSEEAAKLYTTALNHLIRERSIRLAGSRIAYWYAGVPSVPEECDPARILIDGWEPSGLITTQAVEAVTPQTEFQSKHIQAEGDSRSLSGSIRHANRMDLMDAQFRAVTVSANSGRVIMRDWMEDRFQNLAGHVDQWFQDLRIVRRDGKGVADDPKFFAVVAGTVRDPKDLTSATEGALWRAAVRGSPIPAHVAANVLARFRIDLIQGRRALHAQVGLLKVFCLRQTRSGISSMPNITTQLNEATDDPAYVAGRILALLGQIQKKALVGINVGVVERYYAAASTSPSLILGRLIRMALVGHLPKIPSAERQVLDRKLATLSAMFNESPKQTLTMEEQTLFALGYYQQRSHRYPLAENVAEESEQPVAG